MLVPVDTCCRMVLMQPPVSLPLALQFQRALLLLLHVVCLLALPTPMGQDLSGLPSVHLLLLLQRCRCR